MPRRLLWTVLVASAIGLAQPAHPSFGVATVKTAAPLALVNGFIDPNRIGIHGGPGTTSPSQIVAYDMSLKLLLSTAYGLQAYQVEGPAWLQTQHFDIAATVPDGAIKAQVKDMWRNLLLERFGLQSHIESKEGQVSELVVGKDGHKLKPSASDPAALVEDGHPKIGPNFELSSPGLISMLSATATGVIGRVIGRAQPIGKLADLLSAQLKRPVADKTGLAGNYDFTFEFTPEMGGPTGEVGEDLGAAVQQLGLRLTTFKGKMDMLVVDKMEKVPTEN